MIRHLYKILLVNYLPIKFMLTMYLNIKYNYKKYMAIIQYELYCDYIFFLIKHEQEYLQFIQIIVLTSKHTYMYFVPFYNYGLKNT